MDIKELERRVAYLEFVNDQLESELVEVNELLMAIGFERGLETVKEAAVEMLNEEIDQDAV